MEHGIVAMMMSSAEMKNLTLYEEFVILVVHIKECFGV